MTATAVVTGSAARVDRVARVMEARGICVLALQRGEDLARAGSVEPASVDYYVQLPDDVASPATSKARALAALFGRGLMGRFHELDLIMPKLAPRCAVVLVTGDTVDGLAPGEYPHAPTCMLEMLADAIVTDLAPSCVRSTVVSHHHSAEQIAAIALATGPEAGTRVEEFAAMSPEMSFDDWRLACLTRTGPEA